MKERRMVGVYHCLCCHHIDMTLYKIDAAGTRICVNCKKVLEERRYLLIHSKEHALVLDNEGGLGMVEVPKEHCITCDEDFVLNEYCSEVVNDQTGDKYMVCSKCTSKS